MQSAPANVNLEHDWIVRPPIDFGMPWNISCSGCCTGVNFTLMFDRMPLRSAEKVADFLADIEMNVPCPRDGKPKGMEE